MNQPGHRWFNAQGSVDENARRRGRLAASSQTMVLGWCVWLLGSWATAVNMDGSIRAVRWMMVSCLIGVVVIWPVVRLSGWWTLTPSPKGVWLDRWLAVVLLDWIGLSLIFQAVLWPLQVQLRWPLGRTLLVDTLVVGWALLAGALAGWGGRGGSGRRIVATSLCAGLVLGEPLVMAIMNLSTLHQRTVIWSMMVSPIEAIWALSALGREWTTRWVVSAAIVWIVALIGWGMLLMRPPRVIDEGHRANPRLNRRTE